MNRGYRPGLPCVNALTDHPAHKRSLCRVCLSATWRTYYRRLDGPRRAALIARTNQRKGYAPQALSLLAITGWDEA